MSYILDALKRAERERKQGQVSVLDEISALPVAEPRRRLPSLLIPAAAGAVVLGGVIYGLVAWHHHRPTPAAPPHTPVALAPPPAVTPAPPPPQAVSPPAAPTATIEDGARLNSLDDMQAPAQPRPPVEQQAPPPGPPPTAARQPQLQPPAEAPPAADNPPPDAAAPADAAPPPADSSGPAQADRQLQEMPENFRASFPAFTVDVHVYNSDPQRRFVLISGKRYHEGDTLAEGPRIVGIVPEGIVFDWQGQRVLYAISH